MLNCMFYFHLKAASLLIHEVNFLLQQAATSLATEMGIFGTDHILILILVYLKNKTGNADSVD